MDHGSYAQRVIDAELDELLTGLPAIALEGARGVGKTATAQQRAATVHALDDPAQRDVAAADPKRLLDDPPPVLLDEWQHLPQLWDLVRRRVDAGAAPASFLLTGSARSENRPMHSGAGRIVSLRMRPMSLAERGSAEPTVSLTELLAGARSRLTGETSWTLERYVDEILRSGLPGFRRLEKRPLRAQLDGYLRRLVDRDFPDELGRRIRRPDSLNRWMAAYAAATSTTASWETIRAAATPGHGDKPAKTTVASYRDALEGLFILDPVPAWAPTRNHIRRLAMPPKHQLADPALAARLVGIGEAGLLGGEAPAAGGLGDRPYLGALFESLVTLSVRTYAQSAEARVGHLRTRAGEHEVDLIVERADGRVVALEVKLARDIADADLRHLRWLAERLGDDLIDSAVITTGPQAYRRDDGIGVIPASLLGP